MIKNFRIERAVNICQVYKSKLLRFIRSKRFCHVLAESTVKVRRIKEGHLDTLKTLVNKC